MDGHPNKINGTDEKTIYELTQGIIDIAVKLYMLAQWDAIALGETEGERNALQLPGLRKLFPNTFNWFSR